MNNRDQHPHEPVLLEETVSALVTDKSGIYIDCTIGFSGHSFAILQKINKKGKLFGIDYDPYALEYSKNRLSELDRTYELFLSNYTEFRSLIKTKNIKEVNGILFDLGISSYQVDSGYKGLSYRIDSQLDMRLDPNSNKSINEILNNLDDNELANLIYNNSEEKNSRKIAKSINIKYRNGALKTNLDLVEAIQMVTPKRFLNKTLSRVFQAFRIVINNEFENIFKSVVDAIEVLKPGGRLAVITFHSIEDRLIKNIFKSFARGDKSYLQNIGYNLTIKCEKSIKILTKKPISPNRDEILANKRSRSAKLRIIEKLIIV